MRSVVVDDDGRAALAITAGATTPGEWTCMIEIGFYGDGVRRVRACGAWAEKRRGVAYVRARFFEQFVEGFFSTLQRSRVKSFSSAYRITFLCSG